LPRSAQQLDAEVRDAAPKLRGADAVIFVGGWNHGLDTEGLDRQNMDFPRGEEELIRKIAVFNPRTIVVLLHGSPFVVSGWIGAVPAVLDAWYPGMEGGTAIAEALVGDINPAGKLTFSWPKRLKDSPTYAIGTADFNNVNYKEGVFVGYRYFDSRHIAPQFPFGFGLSYSKFQISDLRVQPDGEGVHVDVDVQNISKRAGAEVLQIYVAPPKTAVDRPIHALRGFARVELAPGEGRDISVVLAANSFQTWDTAKHTWVRVPGEYTIEAGDSSRNLPVQVKVAIRKQAR
jgi:beta-glucosidase